ncbi:MAG: hypothetical protein IPH20_16750 [Bacteroidales bacterium]|nr:hypothetical protein [Bacteroidales bacterium]
MISVTNGATAIAGVDAAVCEGSTYTLSGASATNFTSLQWTSTGTGSFSNSAALNPVYTPSPADIINGSGYTDTHSYFCFTLPECK